MTFRPPSRNKNRPASGLKRIGTGYRPTTGFRRLDTSNGQIPSNGRTVGLDTNVTVANRPITQHGMSGMHVSIKHSTANVRKIADRNYYENELKLKLNSIQKETQNMNDKIQLTAENKHSIKNCQKSNEKLMIEVRDLEGQLADYNLALDKWRSMMIEDNNESEITDDIQSVLENMNDSVHEISKRNSNQKLRIDAIFVENQNLKINIVQELERELNEMHSEIEQKIMNDGQIMEYKELAKEWQSRLELISEKEMNLSQIQQKYHQLRNTHFNDESGHQNAYKNNFNFLELQKKARHLNERKKELEEQTNESMMHPEKIKLSTKIENIFRSKLKIFLCILRFCTKYLMHRLSLLSQVKADNNILHSTNESIAEMEERMEELNNVQMQKERDLQTMTEFMAQYSKYEQLFDRDRKMQQFIDDHQRNLESIQQQITEYAEENNQMLVHMSNDICNQENGANKKPITKLQEMKNNLKFKHKQREISENTKNYTEQQLQKRKSELIKIESLDTKINTELRNLNEKQMKMNEEMAGFLSNEEIQKNFKQTKHQMFEEKQLQMRSKEKCEENLLTLAQKLDKINSQLNSNEYHLQLQEMEDKIAKLSQNLFTVQESVADQKRIANYKLLKNEILNEISMEINLMLIKEIQT